MNKSTPLLSSVVDPDQHRASLCRIRIRCLPILILVASNLIEMYIFQENFNKHTIKNLNNDSFDADMKEKTI
jgi:hypothetical protein